ncbi:hypothetical protein [Streptomyces brasiliensis]|uniref:Uncharacterized protein n=1 Tax=Streptomyces brasiliensis TaxID=1954 RepID=A0A917NEU7_9ACTN|nr:hypothetical protein [Streptomyces brasiliensis]GGI96249.1 hypothetical protein GCM10010121_003390 [Streptomyces brasiliensis]
MSTSQPETSRSTGRDEDQFTPDALLHTAPGKDVTPEDLVMATGRDITPANLEWARRKLESEGPSAVERLLP